MIHIHYGFGRGKTSAAVGTVIRMAGHGKKAMFCQFLKDGTSGEVQVLKNIGVEYLCPTEYLNHFDNQIIFDYLKNVLTKINKYDIIVLDEVLDAMIGGAVDQQELINFCKTCLNNNTELIITGHYKPLQELVELARYVTYFDKKHHPYDDGIAAREGIEY